MMNKDELNLIIKTLYKIDFFTAFMSSDIDILLDKFHKYSFPKGKVIIREKKQGEFFAIIYKGRVAVTKKKSFFRKKRIATLSIGDYFGEVSLIINEVTTATVKAVEDTEVFILVKSDFQQILKQNPMLADKICPVAERRKLESQFQ